MGWQFVEGQKTFEWYGQFVGDYNDANLQASGIDQEDYGKCDHAIRVPGASYEIGLVNRPDGTIMPLWDFWQSGGLSNITPDNGMGGFLQAYGVEKAKLAARKNGHSVTERKLEDGRVQLVCRR